MSKDRPIAVDRIFWVKCQELVKDINQGAFGEVAAMMYTIEFQKRGLPHVHILIILTEKDKLRTAADVDRFISAELSVEECDSRVLLKCMCTGTPAMLHLRNSLYSFQVSTNKFPNFDTCAMNKYRTYGH